MINTFYFELLFDFYLLLLLAAWAKRHAAVQPQVLLRRIS